MLSAVLICVTGSAFAYTTPSGKTVTQSQVQNAKTNNPNAAKRASDHSTAIQGAKANPHQARTRVQANKEEYQGTRAYEVKKMQVEKNHPQVNQYMNK